jgi:hypothetical protein
LVLESDTRGSVWNKKVEDITDQSLFPKRLRMKRLLNPQEEAPEYLLRKQ